MATNYPTAKDDTVSLPNPSGAATQNNPDHGALHSNENDAIKALETKLGIGNTSPSSTGLLLVPTSAGTTAWKQLTSAELRNSISDKTGTGTAVFNTSPTLVTPSIDTINESTPGNGTTLGGVNFKSGTIQTAGAVTNAAIASGVQVSKLSSVYRFSAYRNVTLSITSATQKVPFDVENYDLNNNYDNATNFRYTVPVTGFYLIDTQVGIGSAGMSPTETCSIALYKNGASIRVSNQIEGTGNGLRLPRPSIVTQLSLTAGDYLEVFAIMGGIYRDIVGGSAITYFEASLQST